MDDIRKRILADRAERDRIERELQKRQNLAERINDIRAAVIPWAQSVTDGARAAADLSVTDHYRSRQGWASCIAKPDLSNLSQLLSAAIAAVEDCELADRIGECGFISSSKSTAERILKAAAGYDGNTRYHVLLRELEQQFSTDETFTPDDLWPHNRDLLTGFVEILDGICRDWRSSRHCADADQGKGIQEQPQATLEQAAPIDDASDPFLGPYQPKNIRELFSIESDQGWTDFANHYRFIDKLRNCIGRNGKETPRLVEIRKSVFTERGKTPPT